MRPEVLVKVALLTTVLAVTACSSIEPEHSSPEDGRGKKQEKMIQELMQALMLFKNMVAFGLMFVSPIIQIKGFGLSVINTLVNIGRFLIQLQASLQMKQTHLTHLKVHHGQPHHIHDSEDLWSAASSRYAYYAPPPQSQHNSNVNAYQHSDPSRSR